MAVVPSERSPDLPPWSEPACTLQCRRRFLRGRRSLRYSGQYSPRGSRPIGAAGRAVRGVPPATRRLGGSAFRRRLESGRLPVFVGLASVVTAQERPARERPLRPLQLPVARRTTRPQPDDRLLPADA